MEETQKNLVDNSSEISSKSTEQSKQTTNINQQSKATVESSNGSKRQKTSDEIHSNPKSSNDSMKSKSPTTSTAAHYQDTLFDKNNISYCSFSSTQKRPIESVPTANKNSVSTKLNPIAQLLDQASTLVNDQDSDEEEQKKKIAAAKMLLFPGAIATSFPEVADTLRNERRQEFCPIYQDETPEQTALRLKKQKPVGSLLSKRIRLDDLKRKREDEEKKAQMQYRYGPYGPVYANQQSFANPYEQYYATMQNQYEQMVQMTQVQQEHSGFWPEYQQQSSFQNNDRLAQNSMQTQMQPYTYPYSTTYPNSMSGMNTSTPSSYPSSVNQYSYYNSIMQQPPPPPPDEPYPY